MEAAWITNFHHEGQSSQVVASHGEINVHEK